jgi:carbon storage regulator
MLVISRMREQSIVVSSSDAGCVLTVLQVRGGEVSLLVSHSSSDKPGALNTWTSKLTCDGSIKVGGIADVTLVDVREEKVRVGIVVPLSASVHRLEVWEAIKRKRGEGPSGDAGDGLSGSPVPRPQGPKPPSLDVRLNEPPPDDGSG